MKENSKFDKNPKAFQAAHCEYENIKIGDKILKRFFKNDEYILSSFSYTFTHTYTEKKINFFQKCDENYNVWEVEVSSFNLIPV